MPLRAVLFDHDGTLVDSEPVHYRIWVDVLARHGVAFDERVYRDHHAGVPTPANAADMVERFRLDLDPATLVAAKEQATGDHLSRNAFPLMPGVADALARLRAKGLALAVVSGSGAQVIAATLAAHGLTDTSDVVVSGDQVTRNKPAPDCYRLALARLKLPAEHCIAIEDTEAGLQAAAGAGIACIAVPHEMSTHQDFSAAHAVAGCIDEAVAWALRGLPARMGLSSGH